ncbi:hypothetical protein P167DRAFT_549809 [Morchella conica CCBAS932]|uniref:Uncharacterized protein n=1 Tax=Morchella conica CCBAS932 TaxID=1392247 RepID=A0A3N4KDF7_9PEZI|nr:hypothetical protein P167DRAFT_549809 [Morchella conica CCBAS932]
MHWKRRYMVYLAMKVGYGYLGTFPIGKAAAWRAMAGDRSTKFKLKEMEAYQRSLENMVRVDRFAKESLIERTNLINEGLDLVRKQQEEEKKQVRQEQESYIKLLTEKHKRLVEAVETRVGAIETQFLKISVAQDSSNNKLDQLLAGLLPHQPPPPPLPQPFNPPSNVRYFVRFRNANTSVISIPYRNPSYGLQLKICNESCGDTILNSPPLEQVFLSNEPNIIVSKALGKKAIAEQ